MQGKAIMQLAAAIKGIGEDLHLGLVLLALSLSDTFIVQYLLGVYFCIAFYLMATSNTKDKNENEK